MLDAYDFFLWMMVAGVIVGFVWIMLVDWFHW